MIRVFLVVFWSCLIMGSLYWSKVEIFKPKDDRSIRVFSWGNVFLPETLKSFEEETGIKVKVSYFSTNEELLVKLKGSRGQGVDLVMPSDYAVKVFKEEGLLKKLDHERLDFMDEFLPYLVGQPFDPENAYSLPFVWEIYGFGYDSDYLDFKGSFHEIYDASEIDYKIIMVNDPIEAINFTSYFLFGEGAELNESRIEQIKQTLIAQKPLVEAYVNLRADYFLGTKNAPIALSPSSAIRRTAKKHSNIRFVLPKEGTFISIENLAIMKETKKEDLVYQFLNYIYDQERFGNQCQELDDFPATLTAMKRLELHEDFNFILDPENEVNYHYFDRILSEEKMRDLWIQVKAN